jgi:hypothetical protein
MQNYTAKIIWQRSTQVNSCGQSQEEIEFFLSKYSDMQADVPAENMVIFFRTAREFGKYPINN